MYILGKFNIHTQACPLLYIYIIKNIHYTHYSYSVCVCVCVCVSCLFIIYFMYTIYYFHFEHLFLLNQITLNDVYILMLCLLVVIFTHKMYLFIVRTIWLLCGCRKGWGRHLLMIVRVLFNFYITVFIVFDLQKMWPKYTDTAIVSPVSDITSGSAVFARGRTLKFDFQCCLILCSDSVIILCLRLKNIYCIHGTQGIQTLVFFGCRLLS